jgi:hypothetical protein
MSNLMLRDLTSDASELGVNSMNDLTQSELINTVGGSSKYKYEEREKKEKYEYDYRRKYEYEYECD